MRPHEVIHSFLMARHQGSGLRHTRCWLGHEDCTAPLNTSVQMTLERSFYFIITMEVVLVIGTEELDDRQFSLFHFSLQWKSYEKSNKIFCEGTTGRCQSQYERPGQKKPRRRSSNTHSNGVIIIAIVDA